MFILVLSNGDSPVSRRIAISLWTSFSGVCVQAFWNSYVRNGPRNNPIKSKIIISLRYRMQYTVCSIRYAPYDPFKDRPCLFVGPKWWISDLIPKKSEKFEFRKNFFIMFFGVENWPRKTKFRYFSPTHFPKNC